MNAPIVPADPDLVHRHYPLAELVAGWFFRCEEASAGCYVAEGCDLCGRKVSHQSTNPDVALQACVAFARQLVQASSSAV